MLNEEYVRAVLAEKMRDRRHAMHIHALQADEPRPARRRRRTLRSFLPFPRMATRTPRADVPVKLRVVSFPDDC